MDRQSILEMVDGKIKERVDVEVTKAIDNILDVDTPAKKPRTVILSIILTPNQDRTHIAAEFDVKSKLPTHNALNAALLISNDEVYEMTAQIPGQFMMDGDEQSASAVLRLVK
jgi:hypothetical protein